MIATFDIETARKGTVYRAAKLALLKLQAHQNMDRTDPSAREVEEALVRLAEALPG